LPKGLEELVTLPEKSGTYSQYDFDDL